MKILLILPCMPWNKYKNDFTKSKSWKFVLGKIKKWVDLVDIYAIDCIRLKSSGKMIGLWSPYRDEHIFREILEEKLDSYPSWEKYKNHPHLKEELKREVRAKLLEIRNRYNYIISLTNVRVYYECLKTLANEFNIITLPRLIDWRKPYASFYRGANELVEELQKICPTLSNN